MKKFRALGLDGKMYDNAIEIGVGEDDMAYLVARLPKTCGIKRFLEWTGLKDKNGKEIWEGDIVDIRDAYTGDSFTDLRVVVYNPYTACFVLRWQRFAKSEDDFMHAELFREYHPDKYTKQVIGNVWTNKELLNE